MDGGTRKQGAVHFGLVVLQSKTQRKIHTDADFAPGAVIVCGDVVG
jgi:hypothetical protein